MSAPPANVLSHLFHVLSNCLSSWPSSAALLGIAPVMVNELTRPLQELGGCSTLEALGFPLGTPPSPAPPTAPSLPQEELRLLRTSFDSAFASLAGQVKELAAKVNGSGPPPKAATAKKPSAQPTSKPHAQPPAAPAPTPASCPAPSFASVVKAPARPSLVVALCPSVPGADVPLAVRQTPQEVVNHLNAELADSPHPVALSAAQWTVKNNLVVTAGPDTSAHQLMQASHLISDALSTFLSHDSSPLPITSCENVKWSWLLINGIPTGASSSCGPYSPSECLQALMADNPAFQTLRLTQPPSWVRAPSTYRPGSVSSLVVAFEDPSGDSLRSLLGGKTLFAFGHAGELRRWKQKPHGKAATTAPG